MNNIFINTIIYYKKIIYLEVILYKDIMLKIKNIINTIVRGENSTIKLLLNHLFFLNYH